METKTPMSPVIRANWILATLSLLLGLLLWFGASGERTSYPPLTPLAVSEIKRVVIEKEGRIIEQLSRSEAGWFSDSLQAGVEDKAWIDHLLHIAELPSLQRFPVPANPAPFGLDRPGYRLRLDDVLLEWGGLEPLRRRRYVRVGNQIHLISDGYTHHLRAAKE